MTDFMDLAKKCGLQEEAAEYAYPIAVKLDGGRCLDECWKKVYSGENAGKYLDEMAFLFGCEPNRLKLAACVLMTRNMLEEYRKCGTDEQIYRDSLQDIPIWAKCCKDETGLWGMKQFGWLANTLRGKLWRLGRFEFELVHFEADRYEKGNTLLKKGDWVINTHIPEGAPMTKEARDDAFRRAVAFFHRRDFVCESWLLWPAHREMLAEKSNIIGFMDHFDTIESWESEGVNDLWRIFGYRDNYDPDLLPTDTALRRAYVEQLKKNGGRTGGGYGVYIHPGL